jgi:hypothetical protein
VRTGGLRAAMSSFSSSLTPLSPSSTTALSPARLLLVSSRTPCCRLSQLVLTSLHPFAAFDLASDFRRPFDGSFTRRRASLGGRSRANQTECGLSSSSRTSSSPTATIPSRESLDIHPFDIPLTSSLTVDSFIPYVPGLHQFKHQILHRSDPSLFAPV